MARKRLVLENTALFSDPANLSWERYVTMQARERERYLAERAAIPDDALNYRSVSPRYLANAVDQFANNYYSELSATHYVATAAANAPFRGHAPAARSAGLRAAGDELDYAPDPRSME